jgi:hypothetical protein
MKELYAVVHEGIAYIATDFDYYPLKKEDNNFRFIGKAKVSSNTGKVIAGGLLFGMAGALIFSKEDDTFEMKIDHKNGRILRIKKIDN